MFSKSRLVVPAAAVTALALAACGGSSATHSHAKSGPSDTTPSASASANASAAAVKLQTVAVADKGHTVKQKILVTSGGRAIYLLTGDSRSHPLCTSANCLSSWPAVTGAKKPKLGAGVHGKLTVWSHKGMRQLVLNGHPLYRFAGDGPGAANGNGIKSFGGTWWVMNGSGSAAQIHAASTSSSSSGSAGSGSGSSSGGW
jgi:predicted lipoprotein with Yx(FWY)xxD motif